MEQTKPVGAGGGGQGDAAVEQFVPQVVFGVHPEGVEEVEGVQFAQCCGNGGFHAATVVTPYYNAALIAGFVAAKAQGGIVGVELRGEDVASADGLDEVADVEEHDVPISEPPGRVFAVVTIFFADVEYVMCGGKFVHHADGIFVAGVGELSSVEDAYDGDVVAFHATVNGQSVVGAGFFFVVVDVRVARVPVVFLRDIPAVEGDFDVFDAVFPGISTTVRMGSYSVPRSTSMSVRPREACTSNSPSQKKKGVPGPRLSMASRG